jgi:hypothetical protein
MAEHEVGEAVVRRGGMKTNKERRVSLNIDNV